MSRATFIAVACLVACGGGVTATQPLMPLPDVLETHARAHDDEGLRLILQTLTRPGTPADRVRALRALLEYDAVKIAPSMETVRKSLSSSDEPEKVAACIALVKGGDATVAETALSLYRDHKLPAAKKLDGSAAFDALALARLVFAKSAPFDAARTALLVEAMPLADSAVRGVLLDAVPEDGAAIFLSVAEALDVHKDFPAIERIFQRLHAAADPRLADALARYADHAPHPHFRTEAAFRLAELGDVRAAPHLAWRLGEDPTKIYDAGDPNLVPLMRDDRERVTSARLLAELALLHPEARTQLREMAEPATLGWMHSHPLPHANALRLLVAVGATSASKTLIALADPSEALPAPGAQTYPASWASAQVALRYLGMSQDAAGWSILDKQLARRPATFDGSMDALMSAGSAVLGMTYRNLALGAAQGFWEWGDPKALPLLVKYAGDSKNHEQARAEVCNAIGYLSQGKARVDLVTLVRAVAGDRKKEVVANCYLAGLATRPSAKEDAPLITLLTPKALPDVRHNVARVLGASELDAPSRTKLIEMLKDRALAYDAALALLMGGDADSIAKVFHAFESPTPSDANPDPPAALSIDPLRQLYARSVPTVTEDLVDNGQLAHMALLATAARSATLHGARQEWVLTALAYQLRSVVGDFESGPHTLTRNRLRARLIAGAKSGTAREKALLLLWVLGERGALRMLAAEAGALGDAAKTRLQDPSP